MMSLYKCLAPLLFKLDPEKAHDLSMAGLKTGLIRAAAGDVDPVLKTNLFGLSFPNPIGLAAGYDKNGEILGPLLGLGFGFIEAGSITPKPQAGNPKPRLFRLQEDGAVINRMGFNNKGLDEAVKNFSAPRRNGIVGANLGANKDSVDRVADYVLGLKRLAPFVDYITVNVSSPNTPGLRTLQGKEELEELLGRLMEARTELAILGKEKIPLMLKIAPDLADEDKDDIAAVSKAFSLDALIISNTTITRPDHLQNPHKSEMGGLSGDPLKPLSLKLLREMYKATRGKIPLIGVGGIRNAQDAYDRIVAGASLIQLYSAMVYEGPFLAKNIADELAALLKKNGHSNVADAVGSEHRP